MNLTGELNVAELATAGTMINNIESPVWRSFMLGVASLVMIVGSLGNLLTLAAIPYVRRRYPAEFSLLQLPVTDLLINLSVCDLVYCSFGLPHMIHGMALGESPYSGWPVLQLGSWQLHFCWLQATLRNTAVVADFNTIGAISCWLACYYLCRRCREDGNPHNHHQHHRITNGFLKDIASYIPEGLRNMQPVRLVILFIWLVSFTAISPDFTGLRGKIRWTNTVYGCDAVYHLRDEHKANHSFLVLVVANLVVMLVSYSLVFWQTRHYTIQPGHRQSSHTTMLVILSLTYTVCVVPAMLTSWDLWNNEYRGRATVENICTSIYWCMYGINFILYVITSSRMQDMYKRFLWDMWAKLACKKTPVRRPQFSRNITSLSGSSAPGRSGPNRQDAILTILSRAGCSVDSSPGHLGSETTVTECCMSLSSLSTRA